ncbi:hypothetical protein [Photorhabdus noenieputensis]
MENNINNGRFDVKK